MIYLIGGLCACIGFLFALNWHSKRQLETVRQLFLEQMNKNTALENSLERIKQREKIEHDNMSLSDTELDQRLQNDYRD